MRKDGTFDSGDMVVASVQGTLRSGVVHSAELVRGAVVAYLVSLDVSDSESVVRVPAENVGNYRHV